VRPVADEEIAVDLDAGITQALSFVEEGNRVEDHSIADYATTSGAQHAAGDQLQDELLSRDSDGMPGIVPPGIARDYAEILRKNVDNFAFALVTPLGADYDRGLAFTHPFTP
jgi:hypothetical protein